MSRTKDKVSKLRAQCLSPKYYFATNEDEAAVATVEVVRVAATTAEVEATTVASHLEQVEARVRARNGFHSDAKPLVLGRVLVLQMQLRTNFGGTEPEALLQSALVDVLQVGAVSETEFGDRDFDQVDFDFLERHGCTEGGLGQEALGPVRSLVSIDIKRLYELLRRLEASTELD